MGQPPRRRPPHVLLQRRFLRYGCRFVTLAISAQASRYHDGRYLVGIWAPEVYTILSLEVYTILLLEVYTIYYYLKYIPYYYLKYILYTNT